MSTWIAVHKADILFVVGLVAGAGMVAIGIWKAEGSWVLLGASALGVGGFNQEVKL